MEERLLKRRNLISDQLSQLSLSSPSKPESSCVSSREYNELINLLARRNHVIQEIKFECNNGKDNVAVSKLRRILNGIE